MRPKLFALTLLCLGCQPAGEQAFRESPIAKQVTGKVTSVDDGDTLTMAGDGVEYRIRLFGVDCPEHGQPFGEEAKQFTRNMVLGREVQVKVLDRDRYDRLVGEVYLPDGPLLNHELAREGLAWHYKRYAPHDDLLASLQAQAREAGRGLWAAEAPVAPWEWRE